MVTVMPFSTFIAYCGTSLPPCCPCVMLSPALGCGTATQRPLPPCRPSWPASLLPRQERKATTEEAHAHECPALSRSLRCCCVRDAGRGADDYPNRPIRAIASAGPGRPERRVHARACRGARPGAGTDHRRGEQGRCGGLDRRASACADSAPDGYTICVLNDESMVINPWIQHREVRSEEGRDPDHPAVLPAAGLRGERLAERQVVRRISRR